MARVTVEDSLKKVDNRFVLVRMAHLRTKQLLKGAQSLVEAPDNREIVKSLREIASGKVCLDEETKDLLQKIDHLELS